MVASYGLSDRYMVESYGGIWTADDLLSQPIQVMHQALQRYPKGLKGV